MKASEAREIYVKQHLSQALNTLYEAIREKATESLSGNFYNVAKDYDYTILRLVSEKLQDNGYVVAYSDGEMHGTKIFSISW